MLESSPALSPELGLSLSPRDMEKNPNANTKVPPRSSSTGPAPTDSKTKTGKKKLFTLSLNYYFLICRDMFRFTQIYP